MKLPRLARNGLVLLLVGATARPLPAQTAAPAAWTGVPTQGYAAIDVSGASTGLNPVDLIALNDAGDDAFSFSVGQNAAGQPAECHVATWSAAGGLTAAKTLTLDRTEMQAMTAGGAPQPVQLHYFPTNLLVNGTVFGSAWGQLNGPVNTHTGHVFSALGDTVHPFFLPSPYVLFEPSHYSELLGVAPDGSYAGAGLFNGPPTYYGTKDDGPWQAGFITANGRSDVFDVLAPVAFTGAGSTRAHGQEYFAPYAINAKGWGLGYGYGPGWSPWGSGYQSSLGPQIWNADQQQFVNLDTQAVALNADNDILVSGVLNPTTHRHEGAFLFEQGDTGNRKPFLPDGSSLGLLPANAKEHLRDIQPWWVSNRAHPVDATTVRPVLHVVFTADIQRDPATWKTTTFLLRKLSDNTWDLHEVVGAEQFDLKSINAAGVISAISKANSTVVPPKHALLLVPAQLEQASFFSPDGYHDVWQDKGVPYTFPAGKDAVGGDVAEDEVHWDRQSPQPRRYPFCYESGKKMRAHLVRLSTPGDLLKNCPKLMIRGVGVAATRSAGYDFSATPATYQDGLIEARDLPGVKAFPASTVDYFGAPDAPASAPDLDEPLRIAWQFSTDGGATWGEAGRSENPVFVTLNKPTEPDDYYALFRTVLYLACKNRGATTPGQVVERVWPFFDSRTVKTWDGRPLYYYLRLPGNVQPSDDDALSTISLLTRPNGSGECYAMGLLFQDALWANGVPNEGRQVTPASSRRISRLGMNDTVAAYDAIDDYLIVNNWTFSEHGSFNSEPPNQWKLVLSGDPDMSPWPYLTKPDDYGDLTNIVGLAGQNLDLPREKVFSVHYVVQVVLTDSTNQSDGSTIRYYDPSYGIYYTDENDFETKAIAGYGSKLFDDQSITASTVTLRVKKASGLHNIRFEAKNQPHGTPTK